MTSSAAAIPSSPSSADSSNRRLYATDCDVPLVAGHRGSCSTAPENTLEAIASAVHAGAYGIEVDVQLTADGVLVLSRDLTLDRCTDIGEVLPEMAGHPVHDLTSEQVALVDAAAHWEAFEKVRVPLLDEVPAVLGPTTEVNIEIKDPAVNTGIVDVVAGTLAAPPWAELVDAGRVVVSSYHLDALRQLAQLDTGVPMLLLVAMVPGPRRLEELGRELDGLIASYKLLAAGAVDRVHRAGLSLRVYSPNRPTDWMRMAELGVDVIDTDRPAEAIQIYRELEARRLHRGHR